MRQQKISDSLQKRKKNSRFFVRIIYKTERSICKQTRDYRRKKGGGKRGKEKSSEEGHKRGL